MTEKLTAKKESFVKMMSEDEEYARHGFDLLSKREKPEEYFHALRDAGFFDPKHNPGPRPSKEPGFVQIPNWPAASYLELLARRAGALNDLMLGNEVMEIVRSVTKARDSNGQPVDNYSTYWKFSQILGSTPIECINASDMDLVPEWLNSKYNLSMVGREIGTTVIPRFLASSRDLDIKNACALLAHCTEFRWVEDDSRGRDAVTLVDDYWLKDLIKRNVEAFGIKAGLQSASIFAKRLHQLFSDDRRKYGSAVWRSAIEDSPQNYDFRSVENRFVEGFRDTLLSWLDSHPVEAKKFVISELNSPDEITRRVAIHCVTERFGLLSESTDDLLNVRLFSSGHRHELYRLLQTHFSAFSEKQKEAVISTIRALPSPKSGEDVEIRKRRTQRDWLTALIESGYQPAIDWFNELNNDQSIGPPNDHPDFLTYHESRSGPGPTPFDQESLIAFAEDGSLIDRLNEFRQTDHWKGPTVEGLVAALQSAVTRSPNTFLPILSQFKDAKRYFQYALLEGLNATLSSPLEQPPFDKHAAWSKVLGFIEELVGDAAFWTDVKEAKDQRQSAAWIVSTIASLLQSGTRDDRVAYDASLLPSGWKVLTCLLNNVESDADFDGKDAMNRSINTSKGRVIEALVNHALRTCRIASKEGVAIAEVWLPMQPAFDKEIDLCRNANFEFSTLSAAYIANFDFMSHNWLLANIAKIFPKEYLLNFRCAISGLAYATPTRAVYSMLSDSGTLAKALDDKHEYEQSHEKVIEWVSLAYLWEGEAFAPDLFFHLFEIGRPTDLETVSDFFWAVRGDQLSEVQQGRILDFWKRCIEWASSQSPPPVKLVSALSRLAQYIKLIDEEKKQLLLKIAPYVYTNYNGELFVQELTRLSDENPSAVAEILARMFEFNTPDFDLDDDLKRLLEKLAKMGLRTEARQIAERLRKSLPGMLDLYRALAETN